MTYFIENNNLGWVIPGGKIEAHELSNPSISAMREAREEAGVIGNNTSNITE